MNNEVGLTAPWYTLRNQLAATLGKTPGVVVGNLQEDTLSPGNYILRIDVTSCIRQGEAVRLVIPPTYTFGEVKVTTQVYAENALVTMPNVAITTIQQVIDILTVALWCNPLVKGIINVDGKLPPVQQGIVGSAVVVIRPCVIQFFNDDISNLCNNYIEVASKVFEQVFNLKYGLAPIIVSFTTYDANCMKGTMMIPVCCEC